MLDPMNLNRIAFYQNFLARAADAGVRDVAKALRYADQLLAERPNHAAALRTKVEYSSSDDPQRAVYLARWLDLKPVDPCALVFRAKSAIDSGDFAAAIQYLDDAAILAKENSGVRVETARTRIQVGQLDKAKEEILQAINISHQSPYNYAVLCEILIARGEFAEAIVAGKRAISINPNVGWYHKRIAEAYWGLNEYPHALHSLRAAFQANPKDLSTLLWIPPAAVAKCPDEDFKNGLWQLATEAVEKDPQARSHRAVIAAHLGRWDKAREDLAALLKTGNSGYWGYYQMAMLSLMDQNQAQYRTSCRDMLSKFAESKNAQELNFTVWTSALVPQALDDYGPAIALAQRGVEMNMDNPEAIRSLGAILYRAGKYEEAAQQLGPLAASAEKSSPKAKTSTAYPLFFLAMAQHQLGKKDEARTTLQKAVELTKAELSDEKNPPVWNRKLTLELLRQEAEALLEIPTAPAPEPNHSPTAADSAPEG